MDLSDKFPRRTFPGAMAFGNYILTSEDGRYIYTEPSFGAPDGVSFNMRIEDTDYLVRLKSRTAAWWEWEVLKVNGRDVDERDLGGSSLPSV